MDKIGLQTQYLSVLSDHVTIFSGSGAKKTRFRKNFSSIFLIFSELTKKNVYSFDAEKADLSIGGIFGAIGVTQTEIQALQNREILFFFPRLSHSLIFRYMVAQNRELAVFF